MERDPGIAREPAGDVGQEAIRQGHCPSQFLGHLPGDGKNKADEPVLGAGAGRGGQAHAACVFQ